MKKRTALLLGLLLAASLALGVPYVQAEGVIAKYPFAGSNYCHMKFPAIQEHTLYWDRPVLKDEDSADIIDFYGSCDHDPLGQDEVRRQRRRGLSVD